MDGNERFFFVYLRLIVHFRYFTEHFSLAAAILPAQITPDLCFFWREDRQRKSPD
jgi:hypothetical protein